MKRNILFVVCLLGLQACSQSSSDSEATARSSQAIVGDVTIQLAAPRGVSALAPVMLASNSVNVGSGALLAQAPSGAAPTVSLGTPGFHAEPDVVLDDLWSRGPAFLGDRVIVHGVVHAAQVTKGIGTVADGGFDTAPTLDPLTTLSWTVHFPTGTSPNVNLEPDKVGTIAPGSYGSVRLASRAKLKLSAGTYYFGSLDVEPQAVVQLVQDLGPVIIYVGGSVIYRGSFAATNGAAPDLVLAVVSNTTVIVEAPFDGALLVPIGTITIRAATHIGYFAAKNVNVDAHAVVRYRAPNALLPAAGVPLQDCAKQVQSRADLTGQSREVAFQTDIARYCSMKGADACSINIAARTNVDFTTIAFSLFAETVTPATYLAVVRDRVRKERAAIDDPALAALICKTPDQDKDLVPDSRDACPNTPPLTATLDNGCTDPDVPDGPDAIDVSTLFGQGGVMIDPHCTNARVMPDSVAGAFYYPGIPDRGTYVLAGRVVNQPIGCPVWYEFDIEELTQAGVVRRYQVAFAQTEESTALVGLSQPVPFGYIQFNPLPTDLGTRGFLGSAGGNVGVRFRVRALNGAGMRSAWSGWKVTTLADCLELGFQCGS